MITQRMGRGLLLAAFGALLASPASAQGFLSGSNGSDGALNIAGGQGVVNFDPAVLTVNDVPGGTPLDADGDRVFHFTTVNVGGGTTLRLSGATLGLGKPIHWLASGAVAIEGVLDLNGQKGPDGGAPRLPADPGAGGFEGGVGSGFTTQPTAGGGPGGGPVSGGGVSGNAAHASAIDTTGGVVYGNEFLLPLIGGSGGGGACPNLVLQCGGGGAGGGAILIASSVSIALNGQINARGGVRGTVGGSGGHGSGGAIRLIAPTCSGTGSVDVSGGDSFAGEANRNPGRIRIEAFVQQFTNAIPLKTTSFARPGLVFLPATAPQVRVTSITTPSGNVLVPASPTSSFIVPDAIITTGQPVTLNVALQNVPITATVTIRVVPSNGTPVTLTLTGLTGTTANSTGVLGPLTLPTGFSRFSISATFTP